MQHILWEGDTSFGHYQVVDTPYDGRPARVLYSGGRQAAQSGIPKDGKPDMLFDYNQRLFELADSLTPRRLLLIGGGVFTLPIALLRALPDIRIDAVELDPVLTELAYTYFGMQVDDRLSIFNTDGRSFLRDHRGRYDMIVVDAFMHTVIPEELKTIQAFRAYANHLESNGVLAMNVISGYHGTGSRTLEQIYAAAQQSFGAVDLFLASTGFSLWLPQNFVLAAQKGQRLPLNDYVRRHAVKPPEADPGVALNDK